MRAEIDPEPSRPKRPGIGSAVACKAPSRVAAANELESIDFIMNLCWRPRPSEVDRDAQMEVGANISEESAFLWVTRLNGRLLICPSEPAEEQEQRKRG